MEKIFASYSSDRQPISDIYKELKKIRLRKQMTQSRTTYCLFKFHILKHCSKPEESEFLQVGPD